MTELQEIPVLPKFYPIKNKDLFRNTITGGEFWCPMCKGWRPRSEHLYKIFQSNENTCYVGQLVTCVKFNHFGFNYKKMITESPPEKVDDLVREWNKKALGQILNDNNVVRFLQKHNISPSDVKNLRDCGEGLSRLADVLWGRIDFRWK